MHPGRRGQGHLQRDEAVGLGLELGELLQHHDRGHPGDWQGSGAGRARRRSTPQVPGRRGEHHEEASSHGAYSCLLALRQR